MNNYLNESIKTKEPLKITTINDKTFVIEVINFNSEKIFYKYIDSKKEAQIKIINIKKIEFFNKDKELDFTKQQSNYYDIISKFSNYYMNCLKELKNNIELKEDLFNDIFNSLYKKDKNNLLLKYLLGDINNNKSSSVIETPLLLEKSNISQRKAIYNALNHKVSVIEGPPGTGKTTTILSIIANLIKENKKVVVVSKNNTAVDNIIEEFKKTNIPEFYIRFGKKKIMDELKLNINNKIDHFSQQLDKITIDKEKIEKLKILRQQLTVLEKEVNELIDLKNIIVELKNQKKFIDKINIIYKFENDLLDSEKRIICEKNANTKTLDRLIKLSNKEKYNLFEKILIKYKYCLNKNEDNIQQKFISIVYLLERLYFDKEIASKEAKILKNNLDLKQLEIKKIYEEYVDLSLIVFNNHLKKSISLKKIDTSKNFTKQILEMYPLILTTADGFLFNFKNLMNHNDKIDCVIIDEASQCDIMTGLPLLFLAKKIIVVGDSKQLSAITNIETSNEIDEKYRYENNNFLNTIKEVFMPPTQVLLEYYRCNYNIINFCNKYYYDNELKIYTSSNNESIAIINANKYKGVEKINGAYINKREIKTIEHKIQNISNTFVITPFKGQADLLVKKYNKDSCGTIHCFQGKGADNVYFSTVLNNFDFCKKHIVSKYNMFTKELINVAVSRAKKKFILVCDKKFFKDNDKYVPDVKNLIDYISIYGEKMIDDSNCIFDGLYKNIKYYNSTKTFDNQYEEVLYRQLKNVLNNTNYSFYPKIKLFDLVLNDKFLSENPEIYNYIKNGAHADFTIFDMRINKPVLVVELDGKYHNTLEQIKKDKMKDEALTSVNIKVLRISSKDALDQEDLKRLIYKYLID